MNRFDFLRRGISSEHGVLEIGPYFSPIAPRAAGFKTTTLDLYETDELRKRAVADPHVPNDRLGEIEDVDLVGSACSLADLTKNRFGAANELAFFAMVENGLREVANPSAIFLARPEKIAPGSIVTVAREGGRPLLVEIQGLVDPMRFGNPRRVAQGLDATRLAMLLAVMNRHGGLSLQDHDVFVNVVGGLALRETASDLPMLLTLASSLRDKPLPATVVAFGEVGLTGEVRPVAFGEERLREAAKQGFRLAIVPQDNLPRRPIEGLQIRGVSGLAAALTVAFDGPG